LTLEIVNGFFGTKDNNLVIKFIKVSENLTQMEETIIFSPPIAWFGGLIFWFLKKDMDAMFAYRHQATQAYFLNKGLV